MAQLRRHVSYANVVATLALFIALGGGAYAISVPRNSVGTGQLKRGAVTSTKLGRGAVGSAKLKRNAVSSAKVKDFSLQARDFGRGQLPALIAVRADDTDPSPQGPQLTIKETALALDRPARIFVQATLRDPFVSCQAAGPCSAQWGVYVDGQPVPDAGMQLSGAAASADGHGFDLLYGTTAAELPAGTHSVRLARFDSGAIESVGQLGAQLGAMSAG